MHVVSRLVSCEQPQTWPKDLTSTDFFHNQDCGRSKALVPPSCVLNLRIRCGIYEPTLNNGWIILKFIWDFWVAKRMGNLCLLWFMIHAFNQKYMLCRYLLYKKHDGSLTTHANDAIKASAPYNTEPKVDKIAFDCPINVTGSRLSTAYIGGRGAVSRVQGYPTAWKRWSRQSSDDANYFGV